MSTTKNLRKRTAQVNGKLTGDTPEKKIKMEQKEPPVAAVEESVQAKEPIVAPNGKIFYPCQYCSKIFPQKTTSITHMKKCPNKKSVEHKAVDKNESNLNNNYVEQPKGKQNGTENTSGSSAEIESAEQRIKISQNITVKDAELEHMRKQNLNPASVYDYDEQDDDKPEDKDSKENDEEAANNSLCKHCKTIFDNPLELLRHTRDCHNFPRTILPPDEIEKYFDSPNRNFCPICEKPIKTRNFRSVFIKHLLVHTTGLTHECGICKKKFRRRDHMRAHEKRHIVSV